MEAVVGHQAAEVDHLHQVVVAFLALANAFASKETAAWLGEQEKKPPIMLALTHTQNLKIYKHEYSHLDRGSNQILQICN
jgi:hypothetical protein